MHCPHCGAKNQEGNRYCVGCGSELAQPRSASAAPIPLRERITRLIGTTRRARLLSVVTAVAIVIVVGAFIALKPSRDAPPEDSFTRAADRTCVMEKRTITALEQQTTQQRPPDIGAFAGALVLIVEEWRQSLRESPAPPIHAEAVRAIDSALREVLIRAGALARVARNGDPAQVATQARLVDNASARVNGAIEGLGLTHCSHVAVGPVSSNRP